ncbi:hypothetical protein SPURM210S_02443 [Streptomyces purpurascens]
MARLAEGVTDEQLAGPTPCPKYAVRDVLAHLAGLAAAFRDAGRKDLGVTTDTEPGAALPELGQGWREEGRPRCSANWPRPGATRPHGPV